MIFKWTNFRLKTWHFFFILVVLFFVINVLDSKGLQRIQTQEPADSLIELNNELFSDSISSDLSFVLFYHKESDVCREMKSRLTKLQQATTHDTGFYKMDIENFDSDFRKFDISGTPCILIFKNGKEVNRIMGLVPDANLDMIHNRMIHENNK